MPGKEDDFSRGAKKQISIREKNFPHEKHTYDRLGDVCGVTKDKFTSWMRGLSTPSNDDILALSAFFNCSPAEFGGKYESLVVNFSYIDNGTKEDAAVKGKLLYTEEDMDKILEQIVAQKKHFDLLITQIFSRLDDHGLLMRTMVGDHEAIDKRITECHQKLEKLEEPEK